MGMNRKWNMKVFELHEQEGHGGDDNPDTPVTPEGPVPPVDPLTSADEIHTDTTIREITMQKAPFDYSDIKEDSNPLLIDAKAQIPTSQVITDFYDTSKWNYIEGQESYIDSDYENETLTINSRTKATFDIPSTSTRWILQFNHLTDSQSFRAFFYFDGAPESAHTRFGYGMDVPQKGNPHLEAVMRTPESDNQIFENTIADEEYFTGAYPMSVVLTRWDNIYTLTYDDRYLITIPVDSDSINRIGFWSWSGSKSVITNFTFSEINNDSEGTDIIIEGLAPHQTSEPTKPNPEIPKT